MRKGLSESLSDIAGLFDADALCTHRFGDFGKISVLEFDAKGEQTGLLLLDLDEVEGLINNLFAVLLLSAWATNKTSPGANHVKRGARARDWK